MANQYGPKIVTDGLVLCLDDTKLVSTSYKDILLDKTFSGSDYATAPWANNISSITICLFLQKVGDDTQYARQPFHKFNNGTSNASFALYHFHNYLGTNPNEEGKFTWYGNATTWRNISDTTKLSLNERAFICLQWNATTGGQMWKNDTKVGSRNGGGGGNLGVGGTGHLTIIAPSGDNFTKISHIAVYNRELSDDEIKLTYNALKGRFAL